MSVAVVYDTMLFLQAASRPDRVHTTIRAIREGRARLFISAELLAEVQDVLNRENVRAQFPALTPEAVEVFISDILSQSTLLDPVPNVFTWPLHPDDDHVFNLAIHARADFLVTWETRILTLGSSSTHDAELLRQRAPQLAIITPKQFAEIVR